MPKGIGYGKKAKALVALAEAGNRTAIKELKGMKKSASVPASTKKPGTRSPSVKKAAKRNATIKKMVNSIKGSDPASSVSDSEYKASMKKLRSNKRKNDKEYNKY